VIAPFALGRLPRVEFGAGAVAHVPEIVAGFGSRALLVTGRRSLEASPHWPPLVDGLRERGIEWRRVVVDGEPGPALVDAAVAEHRGAVEVVLGIGGGSALDAAKAIAGLLPSGRSVLDHLEDVGRGVPYAGPATPFVAVPTTAGTGSEATRNAVLSQVGEGGFKKSFRHEELVARVAVVDPDLCASCPRALVAADGMDALTQLLESWVAKRASAFTDALAESGLAAARDGLLAWYEGRGDPAAARARMAYAALLSGVTLSHAGLGAVHGLAGALGARYPIGHGLACGTLVAAVTSANVAALRARAPGHPALARYARAWAILARHPGSPPADAPERLAGLLEDWVRRLDLPRLGALGMDEVLLPELVAGSRSGSMRSNPVVLSDEELAAVLAARL
jgi:alcohol dehydrogenase